MKKYILAILIFISIISMLSVRGYCATYRYEWKNTVVDIPIGQSLDRYRFIPKADLYIDDKLVTDAVITYRCEGDWLYFLKDVDTAHVGEYKVWYKAYETSKYRPGTCNGYKSIIVFRVIDNQSPVINVLSDEISFRRTATNLSLSDDELKNKLLNNVVVKDNYSSVSIQFDESIDTTIPGKYEVKVIAYDENYNYSTAKFNFYVYEDRKPTLSCVSPDNIIKVNYSNNIDIRPFLVANDYVDGNITNKILIPNIKNDIGTNMYTVSVRNSNNLVTSLDVIVEVVDDTPPIITLTNSVAAIDYQTDIESFDFKKYIDSIEDNQQINYDNLKITHDIVNKVGSYNVKYEYTDGVSTDSKILELRLISKQKPELELTDITIKKKDNINLLDYVYVFDQSDDLVSDSIVIDDSNVNYNKKGVYYATVYAINSSGVSNTADLQITITDSSLFNGDNLPLIIVSALLIISTLGYSAFFIRYFIHKRHQLSTNN